MKPIQKYPKPGRVSLSFPTLWDQTVNKTSGAPKTLMLAFSSKCAGPKDLSLWLTGKEILPKSKVPSASELVSSADSECLLQVLLISPKRRYTGRLLYFAQPAPPAIVGKSGSLASLFSLKRTFSAATSLLFSEFQSSNALFRVSQRF